MSMQTLEALNAAPPDAFVAALDGIYEHSPWIAERAAAARPFATLAQLKHAMVRVVGEATRDEQVALLRAHPELAGKAMVAKTLTAESTHEQSKAGLTQCTPEEFATLQRLNAEYNSRFGWPFIIAVRGPHAAPDAPGLARTQIIEAMGPRLRSQPADELAECLRNVHRIAEIRLNDRFGHRPDLGRRAWRLCEALAAPEGRLLSDPGFAERGELTVTYLGDAHRKCARLLSQWMRDSGFDDVRIDAVGNVVGVYDGEDADAPRLLTGSHYDTVRNAGRYDGRLGVVLPIACVHELHRARRRLPFGIEVVAFAEEEGQRYRATFLASSALVGRFDAAWLDQRDADGVSMRDAMRHAGLPGTIEAIAALHRDPARYLGFVEIHIEQGPVLAGLGLPLGAVTSINGSRRFLGTATGVASHAGTTPMDRRRDAALAVAEVALAAEACARAEPDAVATVGQLEVPGGSINVVPGRCGFSLDVRAPADALRDAVADRIHDAMKAIGERRGVDFALEETLRAAAAPSDPAWLARWEDAIASLGLPVHRMPSGAGHDAMKLHELVPQAMLFVRGENDGISHNPLESTTDDDMDLAARAFLHLLDGLAAEPADGVGPTTKAAPAGRRQSTPT